MGEINKLKSFRNDKKSYEDRKSHVNSIFAQVDVNDMVRSSLCNEYMMSNLEKSLEDLGTYLLASDDVESERNIRLGFYRDEKRYRQYAIGKNTLSTDFNTRDNINSHIIIDEDDSKEKHIFTLFDPYKMTIKEKRNVLKIGIPNKCYINDEFIVEEIDSLFNRFLCNVKNGRDILVINYAAKGMTDEEISVKIRVSRRTVSKIINRLIK